MAGLLVTGLKTLFIALACSFAAVLIWGFYVYPAGDPYSKGLFMPWMTAALAEFFVNFFPIALWIGYKESSLVYSAILILLISIFGSLTTCPYIFVQFLKLSPEESAQYPIYHVLLRPEHPAHKSCEEEKGKNSNSLVIVAARIAFISLGCFLISTLICSVITYGSPFRLEVFHAPWVTATLIDTYFHIVALLVWVVYKESSWLSASLWIVLFMCFGSLTTCAYMTTQLFQISSEDPVHLILVKRKNRAARVPLLSSVQ